MQAGAGSWKSAPLPSSGELYVVWTPTPLPSQARPPQSQSQFFGSEFPSGSSVSCEAPRRDSHDILELSKLSPQANTHPSLHADPSTSTQANLPTPLTEGVWQIKSYDTVEAEMRIEFSKPPRGRGVLIHRYYPFPSLLPFSFISMEGPNK